MLNSSNLDGDGLQGIVIARGSRGGSLILAATNGMMTTAWSGGRLECRYKTGANDDEGEGNSLDEYE